MAAVFDTHKQHKSLVEAGLTEPQADAVLGLATAVLSIAATKDDLKRLEAKVDARFDAIDAKFGAKFEAIDKRFDDFNKSLNRMNSLMIGQIGATIGSIGIVVGSMFTMIAPHLR
jgi:tetrahydromethanopterin S-methyltransferase subunit G